MAVGRLPVWHAVGMAYRDVVRWTRAMPGLASILVAIVPISYLAAFFIPDRVTNIPVLGAMAGLAVSAAENFFLAPLLVAVHRFILIDEVTRGYVLEPRDRRFLRFFQWTVILSALATTPSAIEDLLVAIGMPLTPALIVLVVLSLAAAFIAVRLAILFPAIAVDAPGATAGNAWADTKGHALEIFLIGLAAALPLFGVAIAGVSACWLVAGPPGLAVGAVVAVGIAIIVSFPLFIAIASRIFQALADRVLRTATP